MANGPANRGSLFNVRRAVLHSLRRFLFMFSNVLFQGSLFNVRRAVRHSPFAIRLFIRRAVRHSPSRFLFIFPNFRCSNFAIQCSPRR